MRRTHARQSLPGADNGAAERKPPIPPVRAEITGVFSAAGRRFVARFVVFRHPLKVPPGGLGRSGAYILKLGSGRNG
jgi:hypothetical protein